MSDAAKTKPAHDEAACQDVCPVCRGKLNDKRLKRYCSQCGALCETCCDGGKVGE